MQPRDLPRVCVKTGVPTSDTVELRGYGTAPWTGPMIVFGFAAWVLASVMSSQAYAVTVPMRAEVVRRHRAWRRASSLLVGAGLVLAVAAAWNGRDDAYVLLLASVVGMALALANEGGNAVGVQLSRDGGLTLTRVHPRFRRAVLELDDRSSRTR